MNIKFKKLMSVLLCCVMLFGMLPVNAFAIETGEQSGIVLEENIPEAPVDEVIPSSDEPVIPPVEVPPVVPTVEEPPCGACGGRTRNGRGSPRRGHHR